MVIWIGLWRRWKREIPEFDDLKQEIEDLARDMIRELASREGVEPPDIAVTPAGNNYFPTFKAISIGYLFIPFFHIDREKAMKILRYVVAHEFKHYLQDLEGKIPRILWRRDPWLEVEAEHYAERTTGISMVEVMNLTSELWQKMMELDLL